MDRFQARSTDELWYSHPLRIGYRGPAWRSVLHRAQSRPTFPTLDEQGAEYSFRLRPNLGT